MPNILDQLLSDPYVAYIAFAVTLAGVLAITLILYLKESFKNGRLGKTELKSFDILHDAAKKADAMMAEGELEGIKLTAQSKLESQKLERQIQESLVAAGDEFKNYLQNLTKEAEDSKIKTEEVIKTKVNSLLESFEQNLSTFLTQTQTKSTQAIDLELQAARNLIENYKLQQLKLVDENVVAMLERAIGLVLVKKLSLNDSLDLVFEALEKAKTEKFVV